MVNPQNQLQESLSKKRKAEDALENLRESTAIANAAAARLHEALLVHNQTIAHARVAVAQGPPPPIPSTQRADATGGGGGPAASTTTTTTTRTQPPPPAAAAAALTGEQPHFLVSTTLTGSTLGRHARIICELCRLAIRGKASTTSTSTTTTDSSTCMDAKTDGVAKPRTDNRGVRVAMCCPTCGLGFHQECFVAYHFTERFRDCNPELYQRVTELKQLKHLRYTRDAVSAAIPVNYMETLVIPSMKKKQPEPASENTADQEVTMVI